LAIVTAPDWNRLSAQVDRRYRRDKGASEVRLHGEHSQTPFEAPKHTTGTQTPLTPVSAQERQLWGVTEASTPCVDLLANWRTVCGRLRKADGWFAGNDESADPQRYRNNEDRYCELMAESVRLAAQMRKFGITCEEGAV
jgi:hypothetical protein